MTRSELSRALADRGLIAEHQELSVGPGLEGNASPWYVQVMMGVCAWFAGLLLLSFIIASLFAMFNGHENWAAVLVIGICVCVCARFLYAAVGENSAFGSQFTLAMSLAGQVAIAVGLGGVGAVRSALWGMLVLELALTALMPNRLHRVLTSFGAVVAWSLATYQVLFGELPGIVIWGHAPQSYTYQASLISVLLWLVVWAPVAYTALWLVRNEARWMAAGQEALLRPVTQGVIAALSIAPLMSHPASFWIALGLGSNSDFTDGSLGITALWPLLSMFLSLVAVALAFTVRSRPLVGLGIIFALLDISSFYYVLGATLLVKSIIMVVLGAGLIIASRWLASEAEA